MRQILLHGTQENNFHIPTHMREYTILFSFIPTPPSSLFPFPSLSPTPQGDSNLNFRNNLKKKFSKKWRQNTREYCTMGITQSILEMIGAPGPAPLSPELQELVEDKNELVLNCIESKTFTVDGFKFTAAGLIFGSSLAGILPPAHYSLSKRRIPFFLLGVAGIFADHYTVRHKCEEQAEALLEEIDQEIEAELAKETSQYFKRI